MQNYYQFNSDEISEGQLEWRHRLKQSSISSIKQSKVSSESGIISHSHSQSHESNLSGQSANQLLAYMSERPIRDEMVMVMGQEKMRAKVEMMESGKSESGLFNQGANIKNEYNFSQKPVGKLPSIEENVNNE